MNLFIETLVDPHYLTALQESLQDPSLYTDGKSTAAGKAKSVKSNLQADSNDHRVKGAGTKIVELLHENAEVKAFAFPGKMTRPIFSRYEAGMSYGHHVDAAFIQGVRTDLAYTLFLSEPDSYSGGELEILKNDGVDQVKLSAGSLYLYPADQIHQVAPVTDGVRLAAVGWIQSTVKRAKHRQILYEMKSAIDQLDSLAEDDAAAIKLWNVFHNLRRLWSD